MIVSSSTTWLILTMPSSDLVVMVFSTLLNWVGLVCTATLFMRDCFLPPAVKSNEPLLPTWLILCFCRRQLYLLRRDKYLRRCGFSYYSSNHKCVFISNFFNWNCRFSAHWLAFRLHLDTVFHCHFHQNLMSLKVLAHLRRWMRKAEKLPLQSDFSVDVSISYDEIN